MSSLDITHLTAFLSGMAAIISSTLALRSLRKRKEQECLQRIEEVRRAMREGYEMGRQ